MLHRGRFQVLVDTVCSARYSLSLEREYEELIKQALV
jgi:hypothetical protein